MNDLSPGPIRKTTETIPPGERREIFEIATAGMNKIFQNQEMVPVEVSEIFLQVAAAGGVQILTDEQRDTPIWALGIGDRYRDAGFMLPLNSAVYINLTGGASVTGFLRWRYI